MDIESLKAWYLKVIGQYADFSGRARRREFWSFALVNFVIAIALNVLAAILGSVADFLALLGMGVYWLYSLAVMIPSLAVGVRRLHDTGKSGWFMLIALIPLAGLYLIYLFTVEGDRGSNEYGPDPKADEGVPAGDWNG